MWGVASPALRLAESFHDPLVGEGRFKLPSQHADSLFSDVSAVALLHALGARRYMLALTALLCERRVIMAAANTTKLTVCLHAALAALGPFTWRHIFVPLLPSKLLTYVCAPYPYLLGVGSAHLGALLEPDSELAGVGTSFLLKICFLDHRDASLVKPGVCQESL